MKVRAGPDFSWAMGQAVVSVNVYARKEKDKKYRQHSGKEHSQLPEYGF